MNLLIEIDYKKVKEEFNLEGDWFCFYKSTEIVFCRELNEMLDTDYSLDEFFPLNTHDISLPNGYLLLGLRNEKSNEEIFKFWKMR